MTLEPTLFTDLQIAPPDSYLGVVSENLNEITGQVMSKFEDYLQHHKTDAVIVVDDLASTMAAAIVTKKQGLILAHLAAGTRSFDITMPKEINRLVIDGYPTSCLRLESATTQWPTARAQSCPKCIW